MRVLVVGGGSAGWIAAATLDNRLNGRGPRRVSISLVESPDTPRIKLVALHPIRITREIGAFM